VVNDHSSDGTAAVVRGLMQKCPQLRLSETSELPAGWVGKNSAVWLGAQQATGDWLLFTDADVVHGADSARKALEIAQQQNAALVSFSPEQVVETWYEKSLIPYVYCRLARLFSYYDVNDPQKPDAAANGQFLLIRRDVYDAVGGHASVAQEVLEDVALARRVKQARYRLWFGSGQGIVRTRMYRGFGVMWQGWKKNLYQLIGGTTQALRREMGAALLPIAFSMQAGITFGALTESPLVGLVTLALGGVVMLIAYDGDLKRNHYPTAVVPYGLPGRVLYAAVLWASHRAHKKGKLKWKGREYPVGRSEASKMGEQ